MKDPSTGKRQARPNRPEEVVTEDVPDLRIVPDELWDRVKSRQEATRRATADPAGTRPERARRARHLFSGLLVCGCCGGGYTVIGKTRYGCASARNKGTCDNRRTIAREILEAKVLSGLRERLLHPDLIAEFVAEYQKEYNRLRAADGADRASGERELADVARRIDRIVDAIAEGSPVPSLMAKLKELESRKAEL